MADTNHEALMAAARVVADAVRVFAAVKSDETAAAVNITTESDSSVWVNAGHPGGPWDWIPIQAWMFQTGAYHPLFGDRKHWYKQPHYPFLDLAERASLDDAVNAYVEVEVRHMLDELFG